MALDNKKTYGFKLLINNILEEIQDPDLFDATWKSIDAFSNSYNEADYPIGEQDGDGEYWEFVGSADTAFMTEEEGGPPEPWASKSEYFFKLASDHEHVSHLWTYEGDEVPASKLGDSSPYPKEVKDVGKRHRHWLDVDTLYSKMSYPEAPEEETHVATGKQDAAKRIEFLSQLIKMCILADDNDFDIANVGFIDGLSDVSNTITSYIVVPGGMGSADGSDFMGKNGYIQFSFTSPHANGRQRDLFTSPSPATGADAWDEPNYPYPDSLDEHASSDVVDSAVHPATLAPRARGLGIDVEEKYVEYERFIDNNALNGTAKPYLNHVGKLELDHFETEQPLYNEYSTPKQTIYPVLRWEKWTCRANFESFLFWTAELIELLDVYYAAKDWSEQVSAGTKPVFAGGKRYMSYPKYDSPDYDAGLQELKDNNAGYYDMTLNQISEMIEEISRDDLLISEELRAWWFNFLEAYTSEEDLEAPTVPSGATDDAPESGSTIDTSVCTTDEASTNLEECGECIPNPNAFEIDWTLLNDGATFFNERTCEYSVVVRLEEYSYSSAPEDLSDVIIEGSQRLLDAYLKAKYINAEYEENVFISTLTGFEGDTVSVPTLDIIFDSVQIDNFLGFLPQSEDLPRISENGIYVPEKSTLRPRVLVSIPARLFNRIPVDYSSLKEIEPPKTGIEVKFLMSDIHSNLFVRDMVEDVCSAMRYYGVKYATWASFKEENDGEDYGDLNLEKEADKIKSFINSLKVVIKSHGFAILDRVEYVELGFNEDLTRIDYISVNEYGCQPIQMFSEPEQLGNILWNFSGDSWASKRTLTYIQRLPDMANDVRAREPIEWNDFIVKYTANLKTSADINQGMPESATECWLDDVESQGAKILGETLDQIVDFPSLLANKFNQKACSTSEFKRSEELNYDELWEEVKQKSLELGLEEFFAGDSVGKMIEEFMKTGSESDRKTLWREVFDKYGACGILALIDLLLGCLLQGVPTADGLALLTEAALRSLGALELERYIKGLSPQQQDAIAAQVSESLGVIFAAPPWESGYRTGSWSSGDPDNQPTTAYDRSMTAGEGYYNDLEKDADGNLNLSDSTANEAYINTLITEEGGQGYKDLATYIVSATPDGVSAAEVDILQEKGRDGEIDLIWPESASGSAGTIGVELDAIQDALVDAYKDAILGGLSPEEQLAQLNLLPGAEIFTSVFEAFDCRIPDLFQPPLTDFFKGLELDFCRGNYGITYNFDFNINTRGLWDAMMEALREMVVNLIVTALIKILAGLLEMLLNSLCRLLGSFGAALTGDFRAAYRDSFCDSDISDDELDQAAATLIANLNGCDPELLKTVSSAFITDLSFVLTAQELVDLFNGEANSRTLGAVVEIASLLYPDTFGECDGFASNEGVQDTFLTFGMIVPAKYKKMPMSLQPSRPILPSLCDEDALAEFESLRCNLFSERGMTQEECQEQLNQLRERTKNDITQMANLAQNGITADLPPLLSPDPCGNGIFPTVDPYSSIASSAATKGILESLAQQHREDLTAKQVNRYTWGTGGLINMIMSSKQGDGFTRHFDKIQDGDENRFPERVAGYLVDNYLLTGDLVDNVETKSSAETETFESVLGVDVPVEFITDINDGDLGKAISIKGDKNIITQKEPDVVLSWEQYTTEHPDRVNYKIEYSNFEADSNGKSIMNDFYRVKIKDNISGDIINGETSTLGYSGEQRSEKEIKDLVSIVEESGNVNLNIDSHLELGKSPKHSLYSQYIIETMKDMSESSIPEIDTKYDSIFSAYYDNCDSIVELYINKFSNRIADESNPCFIHGFPSAYEQDDDGNFDSSAVGEPSIVYLDATFKNPKTGEAIPISPEEYGGTQEYPAFYLPTPTFDGWGRILQTFAPETAGCEPQAKAACDFNQLGEFYNTLYDTIIEDERLHQNPSCAIEAPWDKILDRSSTAGIEMSVKALIRIQAAECMLTGMPSFSIFEAKFPSLFDDMVIDFIIDKLETGLIAQHDPGWFDVPNEYYFTFIEQAVQTFGRMKKRGEIENITDLEQEALDALNKFQSDWETSVAPTLAAAEYPSLMAAGLMTALGSPFGPAATGASALLGGFINEQAAKKLKRKYWTSYIADSSNLINAKILMRRLVRQEIEFVSLAISEDIRPPISDMYNMFLVNENMILGSLQTGPWDVSTSLDGVSLTNNLVSDIIVSGKINEIPYVLEKYIKINDNLDADFRTSLSEEEIAIIDRTSSNHNHLHGVVNLDDWESYLSENSTLFNDKKVKDLWGSWEMGLRISQITLSSELENQVGWEPSSVTPEEKLRHKAFKLNSGATIIPLVSAERESDTINNNNIGDIVGSISTIHDAEIECLVADVVKSPAYNMIFEYCISLPRILSMVTIYIMKTFLPSIGSDVDSWDPTGGRRFWYSTGHNRFYGWDKEDLFRRSKKLIRSIFLGYYNATDLDWSPPEREKSSGSWGGISWSLFWWLRKLERSSVLDSEGNPCAD